jgi:hypothetical protein
LEKSVSAHGGTFVRDPTAVRVESINDILPRDGQRVPIAQVLIPTLALRLIANATNGITKDTTTTREIVCWRMADYPGAAHDQRGGERSGTKPVVADSLANER